MQPAAYERTVSVTVDLNVDDMAGKPDMVRPAAKSKKKMAFSDSEDDEPIKPSAAKPAPVVKPPPVVSQPKPIPQAEELEVPPFLRNLDSQAPRASNSLKSSTVTVPDFLKDANIDSSAQQQQQYNNYNYQGYDENNYNYDGYNNYD